MNDSVLRIIFGQMYAAFPLFLHFMGKTFNLGSLHLSLSNHLSLLHSYSPMKVKLNSCRYLL